MAFHCSFFLFVLLCESEQCSWCKNDGNFQRAEVLTFLLQVSLFSDWGRKKKFLSSFLNLSRLFLSAFLKRLQRWEQATVGILAPGKIVWFTLGCSYSNSSSNVISGRPWFQKYDNVLSRKSKEPHYLCGAISLHRLLYICIYIQKQISIEESLPRRSRHAAYYSKMP